MFALFAAESVRSLDHTTVLTLLLQLGLLLGVARLLGELFRKVGQPAVVGELLAGLLLGPSVLGQLAPQTHKLLFPPDPFQQGLLSAISLLGVFTLLIVTGFEIDMKLILSKSRTAVTISLGGIIVPFICGLTLGWFLPVECLVRADQRTVFCLFIAVAMSISAIPVIAKVLMDLKLLRRDIGQLTMAAAMLDDSVGWIILSVVGGLARKGSVEIHDVGMSCLSAVLVMGVGLWLGRRAMSSVLAWIDNGFPGTGVQLSAILVMALMAGAMTHFLELEAVLGAFLVGILAGQAPRLKRDTSHCLEILSASFLSPIFFSTAGLKVNLATLMTPQLLKLFLLVMVVASFGKYFGCYLAGMLTKLTHWERLALGSGMNPRGAMGVIVATLGLSEGVLTQEMYSILVAMAIVTSLIAPPLLRYTLGKVEIGAEEAARLATEEREATSFIYSLRRVLIPSRGGINAQLATQLLGYLDHHHHVEIVALVAVQAGSDEDAQEKVKSQLAQQDLSSARVKVVTRGPLHAISRELEKGYDMLVLGATGRPGQESLAGPETLFNPLVDALLQISPCPVMVVRAHPHFFDEPLPVQRLLVPVVGTQASNHVTELAATWAARLKCAITILRIVPPPFSDGAMAGQKSTQLAQAFAEQLVDRHAELARHLGCHADTRIIEHASVEQAIVQVAREGEFDLIVMACHRQPLSGRAFLGHRVESVLHHAPCAVAVLSSI